MPKEIAIPFRFGSDGRVATVDNPDVQVRQHVQSLINTQPTERVMLQNYGVNSHGLLFSNDDPQELALSLSRRVTSAFDEWEPGVSVTRAQPDVTDEGVARVDIMYKRKDSPYTSSSEGVNTAMVGSNGVVREVIRG